MILWPYLKNVRMERCNSRLFAVEVFHSCQISVTEMSGILSFGDRELYVV